MTARADPDLRRRLLDTFVAEAGERLATINRDLLALEQCATPGERDGLVRGLLREAHTLKGAARAAGCDHEAAAVHDLEELLSRLRDSDSDGDLAALVDDAFHAADAFANGVHSLTSATPRTPPRAGTGQRTRPPPRSPAPDESVRVALGKLDLLMSRVGELVATRLTLLERAQALAALAGRPSEREPSLPALRRDLDQLHGALAEDLRGLERITGDLQEAVHRARLLPVSSLLDTLPRVARDLARDHATEVTVVIEGGGVEVDRAVLEELRAPLTHLVRNAIQHGIEPPPARAAMGKPPSGTIRVAAAQQESMLTLEFADDGAGVDLARVRETAAAKGLLGDRSAAEALSDRDVLDLLFRPGLSTSPVVTELAGRGVGLDVVRDAVERLQGTVEVASSPGTGTTFRLRVPVSVATRRCLLVRCGDRRFAVPVATVRRVIQATPDNRGWVTGQEAIRVDGDLVVPFRSLAATLGLPPVPAAPARPAVVMELADRRVAFGVDELLDVIDAVVTTLPGPIGRLPNIGGATVLGNGEAVPVLNVNDLLRLPAPPVVVSALGESAAEPDTDTTGPPVILLAEDSITTRTLEKSILEAAGHHVLVAADGTQAWRLLQQEHCDLLVADVTMPGLDGFELTARVRADDRLRDLPVVVVTSLGSEGDRARGVEAGADAYIVKGAFDQDQLLTTIRRLLGR